MMFSSVLKFVAMIGIFVVPSQAALTKVACSSNNDDGFCCDNAGNECNEICPFYPIPYVSNSQCSNVNGVGTGAANQFCADTLGSNFHCCKCEEVEVVKCNQSGFDGNLCKGGIDYYQKNNECIEGNDQDCGDKCCTWGACLGNGNPCDGTKYICTCEPGPYGDVERRSLHEGLQLERIRVI